MKKTIIFTGILVLILALGFVGYKYFYNQQQTATDSSLSDVKARGKLVVGTFGQIGLMTYHDKTGNLVGSDIDIAKEIASKIGTPIEFKEMSFPDMFVALGNERVDMLVSSITITQERLKTMVFSIPYFNGGQIIFTRKDNNDIKTLSDLKNKKTGVLKETTGEKAVLALEGINPSLVISYEDNGKMTQDLKDGKIDAVVEDYVGAIPIIKNNPDLKTVGKTFTQEFYGIATKLGSDTLMDEINSILREMKRSGQLQQIEDKWLK